MTLDIIAKCSYNFVQSAGSKARHSCYNLGKVYVRMSIRPDLSGP